MKEDAILNRKILASVVMSVFAASSKKTEVVWHRAQL